MAFAGETEAEHGMVLEKGTHRVGELDLVVLSPGRFFKQSEDNELRGRRSDGMLATD